MFQFFILVILILYTLRMTIVCQVTSIVLEQFRKASILEEHNKHRARNFKENVKAMFNQIAKLFFCKTANSQKKNARKNTKMDRSKDIE